MKKTMKQQEDDSRDGTTETNRSRRTLVRVEEEMEEGEEEDERGAEVEEG
jgi:hypothetical protein